MKIFISQPMRNRSDEDIIREREYIKRYASQYYKDVELIDSFQQNADQKTPVFYLGRSISKMADADLVIFAKGWQYSRGCVTEFDVARTYGFNMMFM